MTNENPVLPDPTAPRKPRIRGRLALAILVDLAAGDLTFRELAEKYDRHTTDLHAFAHKPENEDAVRAMRAQAGDRLAGLWISRKENRVAELQASYERLTADLGDARDPAAERAAQAALRAVAEELGQLTQKIEGAFTVFEVAGVDMDKL